MGIVVWPPQYIFPRLYKSEKHPSRGPEMWTRDVDSECFPIAFQKRKEKKSLFFFWGAGYTAEYRM